MPPPIETISRQRYTNPDTAGGECAPRGQDVERDFATYHDALARTLNRALHGPGIATGLAVSVAADRGGVVVSPGVAFTPSGRLVVLPDAGSALLEGSDAPVAIPVTISAPATGNAYLLTAQPTQIPQEGERCGRSALTARLRLIPSESFADDPDAVVIGVVWVSNGKVTEVTVDLDEGSGGVMLAVQRIGEQALRRQVNDLAATVVQLRQQVNALQAQVAAHTADRNNPHGTTADQAQALPLTGGTLTGNVTLHGNLTVVAEFPLIELRGGGSLRLYISDDGPHVMVNSGNGRLAVVAAGQDGGEVMLQSPQGTKVIRAVP